MKDQDTLENDKPNIDYIDFLSFDDLAERIAYESQDLLFDEGSVTYTEIAKEKRNDPKEIERINKQTQKNLEIAQKSSDHSNDITGIPYDEYLNLRKSMIDSDNPDYYLPDGRDFFTEFCRGINVKAYLLLHGAGISDVKICEHYFLRKDKLRYFKRKNFSSKEELNKMAAEEFTYWKHTHPRAKDKVVLTK